ncbi:hypothetical protein D3C81_2043970 [compost metagenome]
MFGVGQLVQADLLAPRLPADFTVQAVLAGAIKIRLRVQHRRIAIAQHVRHHIVRGILRIVAAGAPARPRPDQLAIMGEPTFVGGRAAGHGQAGT